MARRPSVICHFVLARTRSDDSASTHARPAAAPFRAPAAPSTQLRALGIAFFRPASEPRRVLTKKKMHVCTPHKPRSRSCGPPWAQQKTPISSKMHNFPRCHRIPLARVGLELLEHVRPPPPGFAGRKAAITWLYQRAAAPKNFPKKAWRVQMKIRVGVVRGQKVVSASFAAPPPLLLLTIQQPSRSPNRSRFPSLPLPNTYRRNAYLQGEKSSSIFCLSCGNR